MAFLWTNTAAIIQQSANRYQTKQIMQQRNLNKYPGGIQDWDKTIYRYAYKSTDSPNLIIVDCIQDSDGNIILPGYYEVVLSDDKNFLLLVQSGKVVATVPVFKIQIERTTEANHGPEYEKYKGKVERKLAKENAKLAKSGVPQQENQVYMNATINYDDAGKYYLIKYERDKVRAWGAIK